MTTSRACFWDLADPGFWKLLYFTDAVIRDGHCGALPDASLKLRKQTRSTVKVAMFLSTALYVKHHWLV